jgi:hypothetical protein
MKHPLRYFLSYAHDDQRDVERLRRNLKPHLQIHPSFEFEEWIDHQILAGEGWRERIAEALQTCEFGILLVSPSFLASRFISDVELPALIAKACVIPVELQKVSFDGTMDLKGLSALQLFRGPVARQCSFDGCRIAPQQREFARTLAQQIYKRLEKTKVS